MEHKRVQLKSGKDLLCLAEVFRAQAEDGPYEFAFTKFAYIDNDYVAYYGESTVRKKLLSLQERENLLQPIPDHEVYPAVSPSITIVASWIDESMYIKRPKLGNYNDLKDTDTIARLLFQEAEILEIIRDNPHPNIVKYHGCITKHGRIVGIVLDKLYKTLNDWVMDQERGRGKPQPQLDIDMCFHSVRSAVDHLHSLGLAHNDICPSNIMVDKEGNVYLTDYGSCQPPGRKLITGGTPGWMQEYFTTSETKHDEFSLGKLRDWLSEMPPTV